MKNLFYLIFIISFFFVGCKGSDEEPGLTEESFLYYEDAKISEQQTTLGIGEQIVLHYNYSDSEDLLASDAGVIEDLYLEIPKETIKTVSFKITNIDLPIIKSKYTQSCFCAPIETATITSINIKGDNLGNNILLNGTIEMEIKFEGEGVSKYNKTIEFSNDLFLRAIPMF